MIQEWESKTGKIHKESKIMIQEWESKTGKIHKESRILVALVAPLE